MRNITAMLLVMVAIASTAVAAPKAKDDDRTTTPDPKACPGWEEWQDCSGDDCREMSCDSPVSGLDCKDCTSGCYCGDGYFRNHVGECVNWDHCARE
uniref:TIL domain-containing protein n=1 Tax=Amblyomma maculatum TaxID=34609 RepID=G3MKZ0_AMBMU